MVTYNESLRWAHFTGAVNVSGVMASLWLDSYVVGESLCGSSRETGRETGREREMMDVDQRKSIGW